MTSQPETTRHRGAVLATLTGILDRVRGGRAPLPLPDHVRLDGRTALVTGATRGLGRAVARQLADRGARVLVAGRSGVDQAAAEVHGVGLTVDLADVASVDALADALRDRGERLDLLVLNAGVVPLKSRRTTAGLDLMVHVHLVANAQLVDRLLADGVLRDGARVVVVSSEAHRSHRLELDGWAAPRDYGTGEVLTAYGRSKLLLQTWAVELGRRLEGRIAVHQLCPGPVASDIAREAPAWSRPVLRAVFRAFFQTPERAARPALWLALSPELEGRTNVYLHMTEPREPSADARDPASGRRLWDEVHALLTRTRTRTRKET